MAVPDIHFDTTVFGISQLVPVRFPPNLNPHFSGDKQHLIDPLFSLRSRYYCWSFHSFKVSQMAGPDIHFDTTVFGISQLVPVIFFRLCLSNLQSPIEVLHQEEGGLGLKRQRRREKCGLFRVCLPHLGVVSLTVVGKLCFGEMNFVGKSSKRKTSWRNTLLQILLILSKTWQTPCPFI